ncbi:MAG TPA: thiamine phosphate synthase [Puia sp.]
MSSGFLLAVITNPVSWEGEADCLEALLEGGLEKLHIRKQAGTNEVLLGRLAPKWRSRLVLHGGQDVMEMAARYGIPQVHGHWHRPWSAGGGIRLSASAHSWQEVMELPAGGLEYVFLSPLFNCISKPGYMAGSGLLQRPAGIAPCRLIGLGGIDEHTILQVADHGWDGAAVLGHIWQEPGKAIERFKILQDVVESHGK